VNERFYAPAVVYPRLAAAARALGQKAFERAESALNAVADGGPEPAVPDPGIIDGDKLAESFGGRVESDQGRGADVYGRDSGGRKYRRRSLIQEISP